MDFAPCRFIADAQEASGFLQRIMAMVGDSGDGSSEVDIERGRQETCVAELREKIRRLPSEITGSGNLKPSIWRVHPQLRKLDCDAYEPKLVSIGPLHHGKTALLPMEEVKLEILRSLLNWLGGDWLDIVVAKIFGCLNEARDEYSEKVELSDEKFAEMLVVDGCFILEFLIRLAVSIFDKTSFTDARWGFDHLWMDLMLLENQIPFFVLNLLFEQIVMSYPEPKDPGFDLLTLAFIFHQILLPLEKYPNVEDVRHLLHLRHLSMDPKLVDDPPHRRSYGQLATFPVKKLMNLIPFRDVSGLFGAAEKSRAPRITHSAKELHEAGVKFKRKTTPKKYVEACELKISFRDGTIEIPFLCVNDLTRCQLKNLIAYEQSSRHISPHFTSYCAFLDSIINTADDVAILRKSGILENTLGSDDELAKMFNCLCKDVYLDQTHNNAQLFKDVNAFYEVPHHRWRANLAHKYFTNPWTIISLVAGILLLLFTGLQTFWKRN